MKAAFQLERTDDIQATMSVTMSIKEWRELMRQQPNTWPSWKFASEVCSLLAAADKHFTARAEDKIAAYLCRRRHLPNSADAQRTEEP